MDPAGCRANLRLVCRLQVLQLHVDPEISMHFEGSDFVQGLCHPGMRHIPGNSKGHGESLALVASDGCPSYSSKGQGRNQRKLMTCAY